MKIIRHYILFKVIFNQIHSLFRPRQIYSCKIGGQNISQTTILYIFSFFVLTIVLSVVGTLFFLCSGIDMETAFGLNACMLNNIGMAFCSAGPSDTFAFLPFSAKCLSILWMILGRLEYFALLIVLLPSFWKKQ